MSASETVESTFRFPPARFGGGEVKDPRLFLATRLAIPEGLMIDHKSYSSPYS